MGLLAPESRSGHDLASLLKGSQIELESCGSERMLEW